MLFNNNLSFGFGFTAGSIAVANIIYAAPFTYTLDANGNNIIENQGSGADMLMYSGRHLDLVNQPLDIPIHHTLGLDTKQVATLGAGWTDNTGHSYTGATASSSLSNLSTVVSAPSVLIDFTITAYTSGSVGGKSALGTYTIESTLESLVGVSFVGTVLINSVKQITNPNSYLSYFNITTSAMVYLDMSILTPSQTYTFDNLKLNNVLVHKNPLIAADRAVIEANPNLLGKLGINGSASELAHVLDVSDKYYGCMETANQFVVDAKANEIYMNNPINVNHVTFIARTNTSITTNTTDILVTNTVAGTGEAQVAYFYHHSLASPAVFIPIKLWKIEIDVTSIPSDTNAFYNTGVNNIGINDDVNIWTNNFRITLKVGINIIYIINSANSANYGYLSYQNIASTGTLAIHSVTGIDLSYSEIANYTTNARKKTHNKGIQVSAFTLDAIGMPTAYDVSKFNFYSYEKGNTQTNLSTVGNFWLEEIIGTTIYQHKFDGTNLTTYTNNVAGTAVAHSPENVAYELGRGVYPKLAINPLATYTTSVFNLYNNGLYTAYNQATRYTELGGI